MSDHGPNVVLVFPDQMRAQATGYAGDPNVTTPFLDALARESVNMANAVSTCPVCSPYRASLMTGRYPLTHGVFLNDVCLGSEATSLAQAFSGAGYDTAYVGKWHLDGHGRSSFIPRERRQGFDYWKVLECTHDYNHSPYYADGEEKLQWEGYDALAQTEDARRYIREHDPARPFLLVVSWGPPHAPYETAPEEFRSLYEADELTLRPNVPPEHEAQARKDLAGYYAHISALDACVGELLGTLKECGIEDDTLFVFTSDHGDMHGSHGGWRKQWPYDESILVPLLLRWPESLEARTIRTPIGAPDIMPTLLPLCGIDTPGTVEGHDFSDLVRTGSGPDDNAALIACYAPFDQWTRQGGGREYRGVRTSRHTYVRTLDGPWLLFDNEADPGQLNNLVGRADCADLQSGLESLLTDRLHQTRDEFLPTDRYLQRWGYETDSGGAVPYTL